MSDSPPTGSPPAPPAGGASNRPQDSQELEIAVLNRPGYRRKEVSTTAHFSAGLLRLIAENLERMTPPQMARVMDILQQHDMNNFLDPSFWSGARKALEYQLREQLGLLQRRLLGTYEIDPYGMDQEMVEVVRPFLRFMYRTWWRVSVEGQEHLPATGRALLVSNHSGVIPWDGAMIATAVYEEHRESRIVRNLFLHWFSTLPFVGTTLSSLGGVPGLPDNATRLLEDDELVCTFPEGVKGVGKLFRDRYQLARFGRGGYVQTALRTGSPIVPVAVVGAEEIYPMLGNAESLARLFGMPYFPITPIFPWLGPVGAIPLPTQWSISFCTPIPTAEYGPESTDDPLVVFMLSERVRTSIQETVNARLAERRSVF